MPAPVYIDFIARGMPDIARAFRSVQDIVTGAESGSTSAVLRGARARISATEREARDRIKAIKATEAADRKAAMGQAREREKLGAKGAASEVAAQAKIASAYQATARMKIAAYKSADRAIEQARNAGVAAAKKAADAESRAFNKVEAQKNATAQRWVNRRDREHRQQRDHYADAIHGGAGRGVANTMHQGFRAATSAAHTLTSLGGGFSVGDSVGQQANLDRQARLLSTSAFKPGHDATHQDPEKIKAHAKAVSAQVGYDADELVEGTRTYVQRSGGDMEGGMENMALFARLSKATGSKFGEVTKAAGIIKSQNDMMTPQEQHDMLLHIVGQGRFGTVELDDLARGAGKITKTSSLYAGNQTTNQTKLLGLAQFANKTAGGSVSEAASELSSFASDAMKHHDKVNASLRGAGVFSGKENILNEHGELIAPEHLLAKVLQGTGGDMSKVQAQGFNMRSFKLFEAIAPEFKREQERLVGTGMNAKDAAAGAGTFIEKKMADMIAAPYSDADLGTEFSLVMMGSAEKFDGAVRQLKQTVGETLMPIFLRLAVLLEQSMPTIKKFLDGMVALAELFVDNPVRAGLVLLGANIAKEVLGQVASAGLGSVLRGALGGSGSVGGTAGGAGPGIGAGAGVLGNLAAAGFIIGAATIAIAAGTLAIDKLFSDDDKRREGALGHQGEAESLSRRIKAGTATDADKARAGALGQELAGDKARLAKEGETSYNPLTGKFWKQELGRIASSPLVDAFSDSKKTPAEEAKEQRDRETTAITTAMDQLKSALLANTSATALNTATAGGTKPAPVGQPGADPRGTNILDRNPFDR